jgi:branched-chain amino acid transport system ATP-binding protein
METILEGIGVSKHFGGLAALFNVSFEIKKGEIFGLIGPNGAGKTTLVHVVTGIHRLSEGSIIFNGAEISRLKAYQICRMGIARTFQIVKSFSGMTVKENVLVSAFFGRAGMRRKKYEAEAKAEEALDLVSLSHKKDRFVDRITLADRKRLELARALAMDPEIVFLDEVMAGLNPKEIEEVMELIKGINGAGVTFLVIEHVMKAIMGISDRVMALHHGEMIAMGTPEEISGDERVIGAYLGERYAKRGTRHAGCHQR